ncbi:MAG: SUMF1/EgtB/PvdO family nonheme iron enzyme [Bacteroidales bacterium]|nr:SUMF1/EgtB/PvdO family nonheme iron enzyme [Bacteroidales bacterium]MDD3700822.1 SUMF1/EgtB/PvdO family nonheme iron enzyme [Bacteroidales bacterium]MDY0369407.1 SUMF1/EgtB/PvdO family nonheme iron enzyme [Bacteroidales bacterium]
MKHRLYLLILLFAVLSQACTNRKVSQSTGWNYNDPNYGGFEVAKVKEPKVGPGLVAIEGGTFLMGATNEDFLFEWNNIPRRVTVSSFFMDETEVSNLDYLEYIYWLNRVYGDDYPQVIQQALPDTLVWRDRLSYNEPLVELYFRHPAYHDYPVVGVSWVQANEYANWRTDRVNELMLIKAGILDYDPDQKNADNFNTEAYLAGQYEGLVRKGKADLDPSGSGIRTVRFEDGILLPKYRLPTEAEWEYAALGLVGNTKSGRIVERRVYPWNGDGLRTDHKRYMGSFVANFKPGSGDYMGVASNLNDGAAIPAPVGSYWPNDYGLYNMAGNVAEWVLDVYRPLSFEDMSDYNPFRGNVFENKKRDPDGSIAQKDSLGRLQYVEITPEEAANRKNYRRGYAINYRDGDYASTIQPDWVELSEDPNSTFKMYDYGNTSLISDKSRVYKGGSWNDRAYFLSPGTRRFLNEDEASSSIGFRCAMNKVGSSLSSNRKK